MKIRHKCRWKGGGGEPGTRKEVQTAIKSDVPINGSNSNSAAFARLTRQPHKGIQSNLKLPLPSGTVHSLPKQEMGT